MAYGLASVLLLALMITTLWGILSIREGINRRNAAPAFEQAAMRDSGRLTSLLRV
jgi:hypothetical protein